MFTLKRIEFNTSHDYLALLSASDAKELGLNGGDKIKIKLNHSDKKIICTLDLIDSKRKEYNCLLKKGELGLVESSFDKLGAKKDSRVCILPAQNPQSINYINKKFEGTRLTFEHFVEILEDIVDNSYSPVETTYFVLACSINKLDFREVVDFTKAMISQGKVLEFKKKRHEIIVDKHCIGGVPNNRTTMIIIPIIAAAGLKIPKTSSRSITSPAGTADTMELLSNVEVPLSKMYQMVDNLGGCIVWGGAFDLSPADDIIIRVEHPLGLDFEVQMIASILSKKKSAGANKVLIDIPVGDHAKVTSYQHAEELALKFKQVGRAIGLDIEVMVSDGNQTIGKGVGAYFEAKDVLDILENDKEAPKDLRKKSITMAGKLLEMGGKAKKGEGVFLAESILRSGLALKKFEEIRIAQGKKELPSKPRYSEEIKAPSSGMIVKNHIKRIAKIAFILGAPKDKKAGLVVHKKLGEKVEKNDILFTLYSNSPLKLKYALAYYKEEKDLFKIK